MIPNGSFIYPQLPFNSPANFSQYYPENFHSLCAAEGLPIYQLAGVNGHSFMTNCPSYLSPPSANYLNPTAAAAAAGAYGAAYQNPSSYLYPGMGPPGSATAASLQMQPSQHSLFQSQHAAASQALLSANSLSNAFQYPSGACGQQGASTANAAALHAMRYGAMPANHSNSSSGAGSQVPPSNWAHFNHASNQMSLPPQSINMNSPNNQAYVSYSNSAPSALSHPSMHLSSGMSMHPHQSHLASLQLNSEMAANANSVAQSGLSSGANAQMNAALLHHAHHSHSHQASSAMYANYQANMAAAAAHSLAANSGQMACMPGMHLKSDGTGMEMLDNVSASMMNGMNGNTAVSSSALASLPATVHISSNGYMPQMMEVIWPSSHLPNAPVYCTGSAPLHLSSNSSASGVYGSTLGNCNSKTQSNMHGSNARSISSLPTVSCSTSSNNAYSKSSHNANLPNGHSSTSSSNVSAANGNATAATPNSGSTSSNQSNNSSKEKGPQAAIARHSASSSSSSYGPSHKKVYNGNGNVNSHSTYSNNNANKSKPMNGNLGNGSARYPLNSTDSTMSESPLCSEPPAPYSAPKQQPPQQQQQYSKQPATPIPHTSSLASISPPKVNGSVIGSPPAFVTKTVNGVQIYALAGNGDAGGMLDGTVPVTKSPPVGAMAGASVAYKAC